MKTKPIDIALIGMDCIFPGAPDRSVFWSNILGNVDAVGDPPESWNALPFFDPNASATDNDRSYCKRGGYIAPFANFDPARFGIMPGSVDGSDPDHFLALLIAARALADSGYDKREFDRKRTSVVVGYGKLSTTGFMNAGYHASVVDEVLKVARRLRPDLTGNDLVNIKADIKAGLLPFTSETCPGITANIISGRIANRFDLQGPSFTVDAACASSLVALDIASTQLRANQVDMAIVGGVNANLTPTTLIVFSMLGALSRSGRIRPFGADADGTLLSEGVGMVIAKRLEDARKDGDRIYAIIRGIGSGSDGRGQGLLTPRLEGEELALKRAYESCGIDPSSVGLIEGHGTATSVGDATEVLALSNLLGGRKPGAPGIALGSIKSMIGHTMLAAGMAGLIKASLALHKKILPSTLCENTNAALGIENTPMYINTGSRPWICAESLPRRAGVSAFGFGGINVHVVLEEEKSAGAGPLRSSGARDGEVCVISAKSKRELIDKCNGLASLPAGENRPGIGDIAAGLAVSARPDESWRLAMCAHDVDELLSNVRMALTMLQTETCASFSDRRGVYFQSEPMLEQGKLAVMVPGEGSQYSGMLHDTCMVYPKILRCFDEIDQIFINHGKSPRPSQVIFPEPGIPESSRSQTENLLWTYAYGLSVVQAANEGFYSLIQSLEISPDALVGHSGGQNCALWFGGGMEIDKETFNSFPLLPSTEDNGPGAPDTRFLIVGGCDPRDVREYIDKSDGRLCIAMDNCPNQLVVCAQTTVIEQALHDLSGLGAICTTMPFQRPYHTPFYAATDFKHGEYFDEFKVKAPRIPVYSSTTTHLFPDDPEKIRRQLFDQWVQPVRFRETIERMHDDGFRIFLEAGPRGNLCGFVNDILAGKEHLALGFDVATQPGPLQIAKTLAQLFVNGATINLKVLHDGLDRRAVSIPGITVSRLGPPSGAGRTQNLRPLVMRPPTIDMGKLRIPEPLKSVVASRPLVPLQGLPAGKPAPIRRSVWKAPARFMASISCKAAVCSMVSETGNADFLAREALGPVELSSFRSFSADPARAGQWLCGRLAAKDAIGQLAAIQSVQHTEIAEDSSGRPFGILRSGSGEERRYCCSIAHLGSLSAAIAAPNQPGLIGMGLAIRQRGENVEPFTEEWFGKEEQPLLKSIETGDARQTRIRLFCIKEAAAKATGAVVAGNAKAFEIIAFDPSTGIAYLDIDAALRGDALLPIQAFSGLEGDMAFAVASTHIRVLT
jgi:acyl transferase domain-containing protein/phosphopantetheinyl transferase